MSAVIFGIQPNEPQKVVVTCEAVMSDLILLGCIQYQYINLFCV